MKKRLTDDCFEQWEFESPKPPYNIRLKELRKKARLNQTEAGQIVSTSQKQYSRWETGAFEIPVFELCMYAVYYNCRADYLLGLSDDASPLYSEEERQRRIEAMQISRYFNRFDMWPVPGGKAVMERFKNSEKE